MEKILRKFSIKNKIKLKKWRQKKGISWLYFSGILITLDFDD